MTQEMEWADQLDSALNTGAMVGDHLDSALGELVNTARELTRGLAVQRLSVFDRDRIWSAVEQLSSGAPYEQARRIGTKTKAALGGAALIGASAMVGYLVVHRHRARGLAAATA